MAINVQYVFCLITHIFGKDAIYVGHYDFKNVDTESSCKNEFTA